MGLLMTVPNPQTFSLPDALPCERAAVISGAHDRHGQETSALDPVAAEKAILSMLEDVGRLRRLQLLQYLQSIP